MHATVPARRAVRPFALALALCAALAPAPVRATVLPKVDVRWSGEGGRAPQAGVPFQGRFDIVAREPGEVSDLRIEGAGWKVLSSESFAPLPMSAGESRRVGFDAICADPAQPVVVRFTFNGHPMQKTFALDAASIERATQPHALAYADPAGPRLAAPTGARRANGPIRFHGRFAYVRGDTTIAGADHITLRIMDEDPVTDEVIWAGTTDDDGYFDVTVDWNDCDVTGCDDPDIYLVVTTEGPEVTVIPPVGFPVFPYRWETVTIPDFTGTEIDFGLLMPTDPADYPAAHIWSDVVRAHRHAAQFGAMSPGNVTLIWPDPDGTFYNGDLHVDAARQWNEVSHCHEFGHYLHDTYGVLLTPNYCNGFCDSPGCTSTGHCLWCPENNQDGWQEGWADWFGARVAETFPATYGTVPWSAGRDLRYGEDGVQVCQQDTVAYAGAMTEGYVMALLRDIDDPTNDDHDGGAPDCDMDVLSLGGYEIFTVFREDDPTDVFQFLAAFRARFPQYDQDLWSTARNAATAFSFPLPAPVVTSQPDPCRIAKATETISMHVDGNGSLLMYQWFKDGAPLTDDAYLSGSQSKTLFVGPLSAGQSGSYTCVVTTCDGSLSTTSQPQRLTVLPFVVNHGLVSWGENYYGQVGNGTNVTPRPPLPNPTLYSVVGATGGRAFTVALRSDRTVAAWGHAQSGELGNNLLVSDLLSPATIPGLTTVAKVEAGAYSAMVLLQDGTLRGWGYNFYGQLGDGTFTSQPSPVPSVIQGCVADMAMGDYHTVLLLADGTVWTCGSNDYGQLGQNTVGGRVNTPVQVAGLTNVTAIAASGAGSYALKGDGTVWAWGSGTAGQLGNGAGSNSAFPVQVSNLTNVRAISAGPLNGYAIRNDGVCFAWGHTSFGLIGDGVAYGTPRLTPVQVPALVNPRAIVPTDAYATAALLADGTVVVWGQNTASVFGAATPVSSNVPVPVPAVWSVSTLGAGYTTLHAVGRVSTVGVESGPAPPVALAMGAAPNPFGRSTTFAVDLPAAGRVALRIHDLSGRLVRELVDARWEAGHHAAEWDGRDAAGARVPAGVYFVRLDTDAGRVSRRVLRVR